MYLGKDIEYNVRYSPWHNATTRKLYDPAFISPHAMHSNISLYTRPLVSGTFPENPRSAVGVFFFLFCFSVRPKFDPVIYCSPLAVQMCLFSLQLRRIVQFLSSSCRNYITVLSKLADLHVQYCPPSWLRVVGNFITLSKYRLERT